MSELLSAKFTESHVIPLPSSLIPETWNVGRYTSYYQLDLKMCQLKTFDFEFKWSGDSDIANRYSSVFETPTKILRIDLSLNELTTLSHDGLLPFKNLRSLDASLNQIKYFQGIEVLTHLYSLNIAHNNIKSIDGFMNSQSLGELNLSNNFIISISNMPSLVNLRVFNISSNKLESLEGVSAFPKLEEINLNNNFVSDLMPATSCSRLRVINAANNKIQNLDALIRVTDYLKHLQVLNLSGNPVEREPVYQSEILRNGNLMSLDNVTVKPMPKIMEDHKRHAGNLYTLQDAARQAFEERMRVAKERMDENVNFLQKRIIAVQQEYKEFEQKLKTDLDACLRYLDSLTEAELRSAEKSNIGITTHRSHAHSLQRDAREEGLQVTERDNKTDYSNVRETDEVLRYAFRELVRQRDQHNDL